MIMTLSVDIKCGMFFRYLTLITKEHKLLKDEIRLTDKFNLYEREERELFTTLTSAVKESHEKERIQANKTKYLSIIGSVVGALIGIAGSTINNRSKIVELKKMVGFCDDNFCPSRILRYYWPCWSSSVEMRISINRSYFDQVSYWRPDIEIKNVCVGVHIIYVVPLRVTEVGTHVSYKFHEMVERRQFVTGNFWSKSKIIFNSSLHSWQHLCRSCPSHSLVLFYRYFSQPKMEKKS